MQCSPAPRGELIVCPTDATSRMSCHACAQWIFDNSSTPCVVNTNASFAPILLCYVAVALSVTLIERKSYFVKASEASATSASVVFVYHCARSSTHASDSVPNLVASAHLGDAGIIDSSNHRRAPSSQVGCPFVCNLRIELCSDGPTETRATLEFPHSPGWHGGTHDTHSAAPIEAGGVRVPAPPRRDGIPDGFFYSPYHPDVLRYLYALCDTGVGVTEATKMAQEYMNWLEPLFRENPDIVTKPLPNKVIWQSSGTPPVVYMKNDEFFLRSCFASATAPLLACPTERGCIGTPASNQSRVAVESQPQSVDDAAEGRLSPVSESSLEEGGMIDDDLTDNISSAEKPADVGELDGGEAFKMLAAVAAADGTPVRLRDVGPAIDSSTRISNADALAHWHQFHAYSCFRWLVSSEEVSSTFQWSKYLWVLRSEPSHTDCYSKFALHVDCFAVALKQRDGKTVVDFFREDVVPGYLRAKWASPSSGTQV